MKPTATCASRRRGFTLMEMLIVLAILGLLLALVGPRILQSGKRADVDATKLQIKMLQACLDDYYLHMKAYPTTDQGLKALIEEPTADAKGATTDTGNAPSRWKGPYTKTGELPKDPWGNDYQYQYPPEKGKGDMPDIWSYGPDGQDNTEDDIVSWTATKGEGEPGMPDATKEPPLNEPPAEKPAPSPKR